MPTVASHALPAASNEAVVAEAARLAAERGVRFTRQRVAVLRLLLDSPRPMTAYQLLDVLQPDDGSAVPMTIYRALSFLTTQGFVHRIASLKAFVADRRPARRGSSLLFLICDRCGATSLVENEGVVPLIEASASAVGFSPAAPAIEARGLCAGCREAKDRVFHV